MKTVRVKQISVLVMAAFALAGCADKVEVIDTASNNIDDSNTQVQTTIGNELPNTTGWGTPVPLTLDCSNFQEFSGRTCDTINFNQTRLYYSIQKVGSGTNTRYKGTMRVYYNYTQTTGGWGSDAGNVVTYHKSPMFDSGYTDTDIQFNRFYTRNGKSYLVGFYEEKAYNSVTNTFSDFLNFNTNPPPFGSIMILLDGLSEAGYTGKLYFRNFRYEPYAGNKPQSNNLRYKCWNITEGPYTCREFVRNNGNSTNYNHMLEVDNYGQVINSNFPSPDKYKVLGTIGAGSDGIIFPD